MADETQRRVKATGAGAHRTGTLRAAVKPHKRSTEPDIKQLISDYLATVRQGSLTQTYYGATVTKNAKALQANFGLAATDEPYLILDASNGSGKAGLLLSSTGAHIADGRGTQVPITWAELATTQVGYQRGMLVIGQSGIVSADGQAIATLLQQIQAKLAK